MVAKDLIVNKQDSKSANRKPENWPTPRNRTSLAKGMAAPYFFGDRKVQ